MVRRKNLYAASTFLALSISGLAQGEVFEYSKQFQNSSLEACEAAAQELGARVARLSGGTLTSTFCSERQMQYFEASVFVDVPVVPQLELAVFAFQVMRAPHQSTAINRGYLVLDVESGYRNAATCEAALPEIEGSFARETGLEPLSSQCVKENDFVYFAQVDAFGTGTRQLHEMNLALGEGEASEAVLGQMLDYLRSIGATPVMSSIGGYYVKIKYYAEGPVEFSGFDFNSHNRFVTAAECQQGLEIVRGIFSAHSGKLVALSCQEALWSGGVKRFLMAAVMDVSSNPAGGVQLTIRTVGRYKSFADCEAARASQDGPLYCAATVDAAGAQRGYELNRID